MRTVALMSPHKQTDKQPHQRGSMLSMHRLREAVASGMARFIHIPGSDNPADVLSKHWDMVSVWKVLQPLLFWLGDTKDIPESKFYPPLTHLLRKERTFSVSRRQDSFIKKELINIQI